MGVEGLSIENVMSKEDIDNLFTDNGGQESSEPVDNTGEEEQNNKDNKDNKEQKTAEVNKDELFVDSKENDTDDKDEKPESVGSGDNQDNGGTSSDDKSGGSPKPNFYSSTASALKDDGVLPDLDDTDIENIKTPEDLSAAIEKQIQSRFDDRQKRINDALQYGVQPSAIKQFEETLDVLDSISEDKISAEGDEGENIRRQLIYNDAINRGFSKERAIREVESAVKNGTDIEDAIEALQSSKDYYSSRYNDLVEQAKAQDEEYKAGIKKQAEAFKKELLESKEVFKGITLDNRIRKTAYESMTKPVAKTEDGAWLTPIQKYEHDNPLEFRKKLGVIYALTDGFNNLDGLIKGPVKQKVRSKLSDLEKTFNSTARNTDGSLRFASGVDGEELGNLYGKGVSIDI
jgi:hypothetical protein